MTFLARFSAIAIASVLGLNPALAADDAWPAKPIRILVGFAAGGAPDALARVVGDRLAQTWNQSVIVENRVGAAGNIAMAAVAKSPPDGYTLALVPVGNAAVNPSLFPDLPYDMKQFAPVTQIANVENVLVVSAKSPVKSVAELIALGRAKDANITYATPGAGSIAHLAAELFARTAGFRVTHVSYRGVAPALTDVLRGEVTMMFAQLSTAKPLIESGELRALGIASAARSEVMPNVPTIAEAGNMPGFEAVSWYAADGAGQHPRRDRREAARRRDPRDRCTGSQGRAGSAGRAPGRQYARRALGTDRGGYRSLGEGDPRRRHQARALSVMQPIHLHYLNAPDVEALALTDAEIIDAIEQGLAAQGRREAVIEPRMHLVPDPNVHGHFNVLRGAFRAPINLAGVKVISDYVDNYKQGLPSEVGLLLLMDPGNGVPKAIIDGSHLTDMRTGAVTAIGAKHLARKGARVLGHIGARGTAYWNVRLLDHLFHFDEIRVHSRRPESRDAFAARLSRDLGKPVIATDDWRTCVEGADIVVEASRLMKPEPMLKTAWIKPGALVVPYGTMSAVELSLTDIMAKMVVDDWGQCKSGPFGSLRAHVEQGKLSEATLHAEIGEIVAGRKVGRERDDETILFWHRGLSLSDIALGSAMLEKAMRLGIGQRLRYA